MTFQLESWQTFFLVFARLAAMIIFNPLLARRNMPTNLRMGLVLAMTILVMTTLPNDQVYYGNDLALVIRIMQELLLGLCCGFIFQVFYYLLFFVGDILDVQFGMSMAKVFDPGSQIQMSINSNLLSILFVMLFFSSDAHLWMLRLFAESFQVVPLTSPIQMAKLGELVLTLFVQGFALAMRLVLPFMVTMFAVEACMGILMKLVPQIHVFVINIQTKMLLGILLMFAFAQPVASFMDHYTIAMLNTLQNLMHSAGPGF